MSKWKYGAYEFRINPYSQSHKITMVGDEVRTLSGAVISQPTGMVESFSVSSMFYQPNTKVVNKRNLSGANYIEESNGKIYSLNKTMDKIVVMNSNLVVEKEISLANLTNKNYVGFDVIDSSIWIATDDGVNRVIYKTDLFGNLIANYSLLNKTSTIVGIEVLGTNVFILYNNAILEKYNLTISLIDTISLPYGVFYQGLTSNEGFLLAGNSDEDYLTIYHIDPTLKTVANAIHVDNVLVTDVAVVNGYILVLDSNSNVTYLRGNTTVLDIFKLEREIELMGYVNMVDDMGVVSRVVVDGITVKRVQGFEHMYDVSLDVVKVNRG